MIAFGDPRLPRSFWKRLRITEDGCWECKTTTDRYATFGPRGKRILIHRLTYETFIGRIPDGYKVCHRCDNGLCCNPIHLFLGTQKDNLHDAISKGRAPQLVRVSLRGMANSNN